MISDFSLLIILERFHWYGFVCEFVGAVGKKLDLSIADVGMANHVAAAEQLAIRARKIFSIRTPFKIIGRGINGRINGVAQ